MPACSAKKQGELAEILFVAKATSQGLVVAKPWGDSLPYDFVVGRKGHWHAVQVKSTTVRHNWGYRVMCLRAAGRKSYRRGDMDFLAAYVIPEQTWYVIPVRAFVPRTAIVLFPNHPPGARRRYERYREAWHLLGRVAGRRSQVASGINHRGHPSTPLRAG